MRAGDARQEGGGGAFAVGADDLHGHERGRKQPQRVQRVSHPVKAEVHVKEPEGVEMILYVVERVEAHYHAFAVGWVMDAGRRPAGAARDGPASVGMGQKLASFFRKEKMRRGRACGRPGARRTRKRRGFRRSGGNEKARDGRRGRFRNG